MLAVAVVSLWVSWGQAAAAPRTIVTSDTILAGIIEALLPPDRYRVEAILPPNQCPGHYDIKLSDVEKTQKPISVRPRKSTATTNPAGPSCMTTCRMRPKCARCSKKPG